MCEAGFGRIVSISSFVGQLGNYGQSNYAATKGGLIAWTKTRRLRGGPLRRHGQLRLPGVHRHRHAARCVRRRARAAARRGSRWAASAARRDRPRRCVYLVSDGDYITGSASTSTAGSSCERRGGGSGGARVRGHRRDHRALRRGLRRPQPDPLRRRVMPPAPGSAGGSPTACSPAGFISAVIGNDLPGAGTVYLGQELRFRAPVRPGDRVRCGWRWSSLTSAAGRRSRPGPGWARRWWSTAPPASSSPVRRPVPGGRSSM